MFYNLFMICVITIQLVNVDLGICQSTTIRPKYNLRGVLFGDRCWEFNQVPYTMKNGFTDDQKLYILAQLNKISERTCVRWLDLGDPTWASGMTDYVQFEPSPDPEECRVKFTPVFNGTVRFVARVLLPPACFYDHWVLHEVLHAMGLHQEHQRADRDCYVRVSRAKENHPQFKILSPNWLDRFPYDKNSIMHYRTSTDLRAYAYNITDPHAYLQPLGNKNERLSSLDLWKIQYKYCKRPHFCAVHPDVCQTIEQDEQARSCTSY